MITNISTHCTMTVESSIMTLTSQTPQSLSTSQTLSTNSHQLHLRQTCDSCTVAKVKCDKGRPACQRCLDCEELCQYSPSRRHGKRVKRSKASNQPIGPSSLPNETETIPSQSLSKARVEHSTTQHSSDLLKWNSVIPEFQSESEIEISDLVLWPNFENSSSLPADNTSPTFTTHTMLLDENAMDGRDTISTGINSEYGAEQSRNETEHLLECEARALVILQSLHYSPTLCSAERKEGFLASLSRTTVDSNFQQAAHSINSTDTLLATNKAALNELTQLFECQCAEISYMALLHLTILSKIVFWYNVVVTTRYNSEKVDLKPMKIQFGVLALDDDDYATLHRAVLFRELQKAGNAIRAFEARLSSPSMPVCDKEAPWGRIIIRAIREDLERCANEIERHHNKPF